MGWETVLIGFGSNLGDRQELCDRAITLMGLLPASRLLSVSSYYETQPLDPDGTLGATWFYNGAVKIETQLKASRLLDICRETERALGREGEDRSGPRTIDLDLLFFGQHQLKEPGLTIPHPRLHLRRFVLEPLVELEPDWNHPTFNVTVKTLLSQLDESCQVRKLDIRPGSRIEKQAGLFPSSSTLNAPHPNSSRLSTLAARTSSDSQDHRVRSHHGGVTCWPYGAHSAGEAIVPDGPRQYFCQPPPIWSARRFTGIPSNAQGRFRVVSPTWRRCGVYAWSRGFLPLRDFKRSSN